MSESRRATLIPFGAAGGNDAKKAKKPLARSIRITFTLPESNEDTCAVFNYKEELAAAKKKDKKVANGKTPNGLDPFDEEDDDVKRIAMEMEAKYGAGPPTKKKRRGRRDEYADIGMGYDESDSFIDNTDGYDEMIPMNVTTLHGGFYINCGALEFKTDEGVSSDLSSSSSSSSSEDEDEDRPKNRKRVLESSDSDGETETDKEKEKDKDKESDKAATQVEKKQKVTSAASSSSATSVSTTNGLPPKKKLTPETNYAKPLPKKAASETDKKKTVKELLKDRRDDEPSKDSKPSKNSDNKDKNVNSVSDKIDAVVSIDKETDSVVVLMEPEKAPSSPCQREPPKLSPQKMDVVQLPENLPDNISDIIRKIKENVQKNLDNKVDLYSGSVNSLLILFERKSKVLGKQSRSRIYQHLSPIFQCKKENLCKRAKNLVMEEDMKRLQNLTSEFKLKVDAMMPQLLEKYERESMRINQIKTMETEESKTIRLPKRKFSWSEETRKMFREIIIIKKRLLIYEGKTKESIDIYLNLFMKSDVKTIWPEGWMTMAALFKLWNTFEKKPPPANTSVELNSSSEVLQSPPAITSSKDAGSSVKQSKPVKKAVNKETVPKRTKSPVLTAKDVQKLQSNNALSITPIKPTTGPTQEIPKRPKGSDLTIDKIENSTSIPLFNSNAVNSVIISPIDKPKLGDVQQTHSQPKSTIQARTLYKPDTKDTISTSVTEKTTKFVNLPQHLDSDINRRVPTEHNIENIMKAANTSKSRLSNSSDTNSETNKSRVSTEIIIPKLEMDGSPISIATNATRIPLENFMPKPIIEIKKEAADDAVIILDDEDGAPAPRTTTTTNNTDPKRKQASKSKNKYYDASLYQPVKSACEPKNKIGSKPEVILDNDKSTKKDIKNHEGEDILKLMENLKRLNNMTAYNKNVSTKSTVSSTSNMSSSPQSSNEQAKTDYSGISFQDVYHRQFLTDLKNSLGTPPSTTTSSKNYNSAHSSSSTSHPEKHYSNSNNNYTAAQGALKYKNNYTTQQHTGTFNLVDDMIANLTEFAYPQTASHKQKPPHK